MSRASREELSRLTPYDDEYATCERTLAVLRVYGDDLDPAVITARLGILPTSFQKNGEVRTNSLGRQRTIKIGGWFLSSENDVESKDVRRHLDWILAQVLPRVDALREVQEMAGISMNVNCIWWSGTGGGGPTLWPEQMRGLAELNLECSFDVAFYGDEGDQDEQGR